MNNNKLPPPKLPPSIIETERLLLRTPRIEDAFALRDLAAADAAFAHATVGEAPSTLEDACTAIARMLEDRRSGIGSWWVVAEKATGRVVGLTGYSSRHASIGPINALATDVLGRGYATETIEALIVSVRPQLRHHDRMKETRPEAKSAKSELGARWYWQNKSVRPARPGVLRCA